MTMRLWLLGPNVHTFGCCQLRLEQLPACVRSTCNVCRAAVIQSCMINAACCQVLSSFTIRLKSKDPDSRNKEHISNEAFNGVVFEEVYFYVRASGVGRVPSGGGALEDITFHRRGSPTWRDKQCRLRHGNARSPSVHDGVQVPTVRPIVGSRDNT